MPQQPDAAPTHASSSLWKTWACVLLALCWLLFFFLYFYSQTLPNASTLPDGSKPTRWFVWENVGEILLDDLLPIREPDAPPAGLRYLPQRIGFLAIAACVYILAYLLGTGIFKLVGGTPKVTGRLEWHSLSVAMGLSGLSLLTLGLGLFGLLNRVAFLVAYLGVILFWAYTHARSAGGFSAWQGRIRSWTQLKYYKWSNATFTLQSPRVWGTLLLTPFLIAILLGAMLPSTDFDVKEYHFGGPKEFYQAGEIKMLPHNVYTSFPFLTEMLTLTGMVLYGDWYWGAIAGKAILCGFAPLTALLSGVLVNRWLGSVAGWLTAIVYLTIPWTYRISIIAYTEGGLALYVAASLLATAVAVAQLSKRKTAFPCLLCCGIVAGSAAACKYPGLISVTIPIALFLGGAYIQAVRLGMRNGKQLGIAAATFIVGVLFAFGPWLGKNLIETGNPVYPLLYSVFGGEDWDLQMNEKWRRGHSPDHHQLGHLWTSFLDVTTINDWQSPLILGFGLIGFLAYCRQMKSIRWLGVYLVWLFLTWWALTHRIDRFWVPLLPAASCLAGCGAFWLYEKSRWALALPSIPALVYNLAFITTGLCGYNAYVIDLNAARQITANITSPETVFLNDYMKNRRGKVLFVGEAELFDAEFPYVYNTVFDRSLLAEWTGLIDRDTPEGEWELRNPEVIHEVFRENGITEILVNWQEILRYRLTYGYTDYVTPQRFLAMQQAGLIGEAIRNTPFTQPFEHLSAQQQQEIERWAPELIIEENGQRFFVTMQLFPVL